MKTVDIFKKYVLKYKFYTLIFAALSIGIWALSMLMPYITGRYIDTLVKFQRKEEIYVFIKIITVISIAEILITYFKSMVKVKLETKVSFDINYSLLEHVKKLPISYFKDINSSYLTKRINSDSTSSASFIIDNFINIITNFFMFIVVSFLIFKINVSITLLLLIFIPIYVLLYHKFRKPLFDKSYVFNEKQNRFFSKMNEQIFNIRLVKTNSWFNSLGKELKRSFDSLFESTLKYTRVAYLFSNINLTIKRVSSIIIFSVGGIQVMDRSISIGEFTIINTYFSMLLTSTTYFLNLGKNYQEFLGAHTRMKEITDIKIEHNGEKKINKISSIDLKNVNFTYDNNKVILKDFNYNFKKGNIYCVIGENGIGKSTLIDLIIGLKNTYEGDIYYNTDNIRDLDIYSIRESIISVTDQEPSLINNTIKNNLCYGFDSIDHTSIEKWCEKLNILNLINNLPNGFDTVISEKSTNLSGGEKQKLSIIKSLIKNPDILILDEPTSALDNESIWILKVVLKEVCSEKIVIIVTHDYTLLDIADCVIDFNTIAKENNQLIIA